MLKGLMHFRIKNFNTSFNKILLIITTNNLFLKFYKFFMEYILPINLKKKATAKQKFFLGLIGIINE